MRFQSTAWRFFTIVVIWIRFLQLVSAASFLMLSTAALVRWASSRHRDQLLLFAAMFSFGLMGLVGLVSRVTEFRYPILGHVTLVGLIASALVLMEFRHTVIPLSATARRIAWGTSVALLGAGFFAQFPYAERPILSGAQMIVALMIVAWWLFSMLEPAIRFRVAARSRPPVERARLRLLTAAYADLVFVVIVGMVLQSQRRPEVALVMQAVALLSVPLFFIAVATPARVKRRWLDREAERASARLLSTMPAIVWAVDTNLRLTMYSQSGRNLDPPGLTAGRSIRDILAEKHLTGSPSASTALGAHRQVLAGASLTYDFEDQHEEVYECRLEPLHGPDGAIAGAIGMAVDVTERRRAEFALREALQRERDAAQRLRALDEMKNSFLNAVSHELRTPLTSVVGFASTLLREGSLSPLEREMVIERLIASADKLQVLLGDLLDIDRLRRGLIEPNRRTVDIGALLERVAAAWSAESGRSVLVEQTALFCSIDPPKVERIVENLLANAGKYTPADARIWVSASAANGGVELRVEDDGPGVDPELRGEVFEPFRQGRERAHAPGVGIGLSLVSSFAELHGGRAWVEARAGGGASFRVWIPGAVPSAIAASA